MPKKYDGAVSLDRSPSPCLQACTSWDTCPASLAPLLCSSTRKKTSGTEIRKTLDVKLRFVGIKTFVSFNFGQVQLLSFIAVMIRSYSFGHLYSVILTTLKVSETNFCSKLTSLRYFSTWGSFINHTTQLGGRGVGHRGLFLSKFSIYW